MFTLFKFSLHDLRSSGSATAYPFQLRFKTEALSCQNHLI